MSDDQEVVIIGKDGQEHVFPAGFDPMRAAAIVRGDAAPAPSGPRAQPLAKITPVQSHRDTSPRESGLGFTDPTAPADRADSIAGRLFGTRGGYAQYGPASQSMRDQYQRSENKAQWNENKPMIYSGIATALVPPSAAYTIPAAIGGGSLGSYSRGDDPKTIAWEGAKAGLAEGIPRGIVNLAGRGAHWTMGQNVSKKIADDFPNVDIAQELLDRGALPGSKGSAARITGESMAANAARDVAAKQVPSMNAVAAVKDYQKLYQEAVQAQKWDRADQILAEAKKVIADIRNPRSGVPQGTLSGPGQMTRKTLAQNEAAAAIDDPFRKDLIPGLRKAESNAYVRNIRTVPGAAEALDESQKLMAVDQVMQNKGNVQIGNSARLGGLPAAIATSPTGLGVTAHVINQGRQLLHPNVARLLASLMSSHDTPPPEE